MIYPLTSHAFSCSPHPQPPTVIYIFFFFSQYRASYIHTRKMKRWNDVSAFHRQLCNKRYLIVCITSRDAFKLASGERSKPGFDFVVIGIYILLSTGQRHSVAAAPFFGRSSRKFSCREEREGSGRRERERERERQRMQGSKDSTFIHLLTEIEIFNLNWGEALHPRCFP